MTTDDRKRLAAVLDKRMKFREHSQNGSTQLFFHAPLSVAEEFKDIAGCGSVFKAGGSYRWSLTDRKKIDWLLSRVEEFLETPEGRRRAWDVRARLDFLERRRKTLLKFAGGFEPDPKRPVKRATLTPEWDSSVVARVKALEANG